jgi:hypothetical protein
MEREPSRYAAQKSIAWVFLAAGALVCFGAAACILLLVVAGRSGIWALAVLPAAAITILGVCSLVLAGWSVTVRYELSPTRLSLHCGSVKYNVPLEDVTGVNKADLRARALSGTRFPGFALGKNSYGGVGDVVMCSTRSHKGIILVETRKKKYGVTPADEKAFLAELEGYLEAR